MKCVNAVKILPEALIEALQEYVQAGYIYIPAKADQHKAWGERSGYRQALAERNAKIAEAYRGGIPLEELAEQYFLSIHAIRKIIYQK